MFRQLFYNKKVFAIKPHHRQYVTVVRHLKKNSIKQQTESMKFIYYNLLFILVALTSCSNASQPNDPIPEHETFKIQSKQVGEERVINVWTPENYNLNCAIH